MEYFAPRRIDEQLRLSRCCCCKLGGSFEKYNNTTKTIQLFFPIQLSPHLPSLTMRSITILVALFVILLIFATAHVCTAQDQPTDPNCPVTQYRPEAEVDEAVQDIRKKPFSDGRFKSLTTWLETTSNSNLPFTSGQIVKMMGAFPYSDEKVMAVDKMQPWLVGMTGENIRDVLKSFPFSSDRFVVLDAIKDLLFNVTLQNKQTIASVFHMSFDREKAMQMMADLVPRNCFFGGVKERVVNFIIDVSGSMSEKVPRQPYTRLDVVKQQLTSAIKDMLKPYQLFNIEPFSDRVTLWSPSGPVNATQANVDLALPYVQKLVASGGTNSQAALRVSFQQRELIAAYMLSDGAPTDGRPDDIIANVVKWNKERVAERLQPIKVHSILFMPGVPDNEKTKEIEFMKGLALATNGVYKNIDGGVTL